ncbi:MAG: murein biosynthesis integral membrane protein MurJ [Candidatus Promineifilaceae bacterium]
MPPSPAVQSAAARGRQVMAAAAVVGAAFVVSRMLGLVRDAVITYFFDIDSLASNAYFIASRFPETIFYVIAGGALGSAFIPTFSAYGVRQDERGAWRLFSAVVNLVLVATTAAALLVAVFAPQILVAFYPELLAQQPGLLPVAARLLRLLLITPIIFGASGVAMAALNARQHFLMPAVAPIIYNLGIIAGALLFAPDVMGLGYGAVAGAAGHLLVQLPALGRAGARYEPVLTLSDQGVRQVLRLMAPRVLGLSFGQLNHLVTQFMAQGLVVGSIPALGLAWRVMIMPQGVIGQALGIAAFPTLAELAARRALAEMQAILTASLRLILFFSLPAAALLIALRLPLTQLLFERGAFDAESSAFVAWGLLWYAWGLAGLAAIEVISRAFYALEDTWTPVLAGLLQLASMAALGLWLSGRLFPAAGWPAFGGLALGYSLSTYLEVGLLLILLRPKLGAVGGRALAAGLGRMGLAAFAAAAAAGLGLRLAGPAPLAQLAAGGLLGGLAFLAAAVLLKVAEARRMLAAASRRLSCWPLRRR